MNLWGVELADDRASADERRYVAEVAARFPGRITLQQMWALMDEAWDACGASTERLDSDAVRAFYRHPVWLANGVFADVDPESRAHRDALARWIAGTGARAIVDFGGGYGALARRVALRVPDADIRIVDPYPSAVAVAASTGGVRYVAEIREPADVLVAQDVLEHVGDPVGLASRLVAHVRPGGKLLFANCFEPCIKCHVPATFHLRETFPRLMALLGCADLGPVPGCEHARAFERVREGRAPGWRLKVFEAASRLRHWARR